MPLFVFCSPWNCLQTTLKTVSCFISVVRYVYCRLACYRSCGKYLVCFYKDSTPHWNPVLLVRVGENLPRRVVWKVRVVIVSITVLGSAFSLSLWDDKQGTSHCKRVYAVKIAEWTGSFDRPTRCGMVETLIHLFWLITFCSLSK